MEDDFRNLIAKVWANLDNPIKRYDFFKVSLILCMSALSGGTLLISVMSQQYNCLMVLNTKFYKILLFMKMYLPSSFILRYVRAEMNVQMHAFMNELDQKDYWYPRKIKNCENIYMYKVNGELSSCDITYSCRVPSREGNIHNFA